MTHGVGLSQAERLKRMRRWKPGLFTTPVPLQLGLFKQMRPETGAPMSRKQVQAFLHHWTESEPYLACVAHGTRRYGLNGEVCPLTVEHQVYAALKLADLQSKKESA